MGRGTAILRFGSALHSRRFPGPSTQRLFHWLEAQLDMRGVDPALYSRYLISLLQLDDADFERSETSDHEGDWPADRGNGGGGAPRRASKRSRRKRQQQQPQQPQPQQQQPQQPTECDSNAAIGLASGVSSRKRAAAVRCLQSACSDPYEVDELIDELCYRLRRLPLGGRSSAPASAASAASSEARAGSPLPEAEAQRLGSLMEMEEDEEVAEEETAPAQAEAATADSGRSITPDEEGDVCGGGDNLMSATEEAEADYVCAFPALSQAGSAAARHQHQQQQQQLHSAWTRGPPRGLRGLRGRDRRGHSAHSSTVRQHARAARRRSSGGGGQQQQQQQQQRRQVQSTAADEGFLEGDENGDGDDEDDDEEAEDDALSVTSEGSEILQLVSHILHSFNRELEEAEKLEMEGPPEPQPPRVLWGGGVGDAAEQGEDGGLLTIMDDAEALSDHDFDNLPSQEGDEPEIAEIRSDTDADGDTDEDEAVAVAVAKDEALPAPPPPPSVSMATGILALPEQLALSGMANWTPLDRLRRQMWSRKPLPPKQPPQLPQPHHNQPLSMSPLEKSKRACSFLLRGHCKKEDCEFAHDLAKVTCKFWLGGDCFKGDTCPFLHGYPSDGEEEEKDKAEATAGGD